MSKTLRNYIDKLNNTEIEIYDISQSK